MPDLILAVEGLSLDYGNRNILDRVGLRIHRGEKIALVGSNGSGKSTLLRLLAGAQSPTGGEVHLRTGLRVAYLPQLIDLRMRVTVAEAILEQIGVAPASRRLRRAEQRLAGGQLDGVDEHAAALDEWLSLGGAEAAARLPGVAREVGLDPALLDRPLAELSGGQAARAGLAALRIAALDLALIDEPSNHLDAAGLGLLTETLANADFAYLMASHDRSLLAVAAERVVAIEGGSIDDSGQDWETFRRERQRARERAAAEHTAAVAERDRLAALERRVRQRAVAGASRVARRDERDKHIRFANLQSAQKNTAASGIAKRLERISIPEKPWQPALPHLLLGAAQPVHSAAIFDLRQVVLRRGGWRSRAIDLTIAPGERVLISGPNGAGKSSLIGLLAGRLEPESGEVFRAAKARVRELAQHRDGLLSPDRDLISALRSALPGTSDRAARAALAAIGLGPDRAGLPIPALSAGELTRAELAVIAGAGAACLLLDEPSNHLDVEALETLEQALESWPGALVAATHDPLMREAIRFDRSFEL